LCTTAPVLVAAFNSRLPKLLKLFCGLVIPVAAVGEILTISRAGVVILSSVLLGTMVSTARLRLNMRTFAWTLVILVGAAGLAAKSWKTLSSRFHESSLKEEYENKKNLGRGYYIRIAKAIALDRVFGVGLNNWSYWVSNKYGREQGYPFVPYSGTDMPPVDQVPENSNLDEAQAAPAHSLGALTVGELGIPGFFLFSLVWARWFQMGGSFLRRRDPNPLGRIPVGILFGFCGMFLQCLTEWFFRHLPLYYVFHVMLGVLMSLYYIKRHPPASMQPATEPERVAQPPVFAQSWI
ncbi:MAG: O-antigen ligase family protein, partial [Limisphaerales bacterium]